MIRKALLFLTLSLAAFSFVANRRSPTDGGPFGLPSADEAGRVKLGFLDCEASVSPRSWVRTDLILVSPRTAFAVAAHENDHEQYVREYFGGNCLLFKTAVNVNPHILVDLEARGFCKSVLASVAMGVYSFQAALDVYSFDLSSYPVMLEYGYDREDARRMILEHCDDDGNHMGSAGGAADSGDLRPDSLRSHEEK